jgi:hypothetical protein
MAIHDLECHFYLSVFYFKNKVSSYSANIKASTILF